MKLLFLIFSVFIGTSHYFNFDNSLSGNDFPDTTGVFRISKDDLMKTDTYLASREIGGRMGGSEGFYKAAEHMAGEFKKLNLKPLGDNGYFQNLTVEYNEILPPCKFNLINPDGSQKIYSLGKDFVCRGFTGSGKFTADVVFCGYGFSEPAYDDYNNIDVKGKIVMIFKQNPAWKLDDKDWSPSLRNKEKIASDRGALAIIFVSKPNDQNPQKPIGSVLDGEGTQNENFPMIHADIPVANEILESSGNKITDLQTIIDSLKQPHSFDLQKSVLLEVNAKYEKDRKTMNVVGMLEGSDEKLKNEYLILGAHLDHVGTQANEIYFPGANDNGSGSSAVLEMARAFANCSERPKRSIVFVLFSNEESGMHGSGYFAGHPPVPIEKTVAMFNLDCIASGDSIHLGNGKSAPELWNLAKNIDKVFTKSSIENTWNGGGADATPFHQKGIPCLYFVSFYSYTHLHLITDTPETLNPSLFEKITKLCYVTAREVADGNYKRETVVN